MFACINILGWAAVGLLRGPDSFDLGHLHVWWVDIEVVFLNRNDGFSIEPIDCGVWAGRENPGPASVPAEWDPGS